MKRAVILALLLLSACATKPQAYPPRTDIIAATAPKPKPSAAILTDPAESDRHSARIEAWGEGVRAAGVRLCKFFAATGMPDLDCD